MDGKRAGRLCAALAAKVDEQIGADNIDIVFSPAMGGVIVGFETAKHLNKPSIFCERVEGKFQLRRGFTLEQGAKVLVIEDVVTTGKSSIETFDLINELGGVVVAEAALINRSGIDNPVGDVPLITLEKLEIKTYSENEVPANLSAVPITKPGSRFIKK